jgi:two-component system NarL family sensor kinase
MARLYFLLFNFLAFFLGNRCLAQPVPESLAYKLEHAVNDSIRTRILLDIGEAMEETSPGKSMVYYKQALSESIRIKNNWLLLSSYNDVGLCYSELNDMDSAILSLRQSVGVARQLNDTVKMAKILANIGNMFLTQKDRITAIDYYVQSARLWEACSDQRSLGILYSNINELMNQLEEYNKALEYGVKALALARKNGDDYSTITALVNLSGTYVYLGRYEEGYSQLEKALPIAKRNGSLTQLATIYQDLGGYYFSKKDYPASLENYLESYRYERQIGDSSGLSTTYTVLAEVYYELRQDKKARQFAGQAERLAVKIGSRADLKDIYKIRAKIEQQAGNYKLAAAYFLGTIILADSLFKTGASEKVADAEAKYQNEKKSLSIVRLEKDKEIQSLSLKEKSTLNLLLLVAVAILLVTGFMVYLNIRHRSLLAKNEAELHQQHILALEKDRQLVAVGSILKGQEEERSRLAKDLHDGLGGLLSGVKFSLINMKDNLMITHDNMTVFERSLDMLDTSIKELRRVAHNMMPEMLAKFGLDESLKEYCNTINAAKLFHVKYQSLGMAVRLERSSEIVIYRIIQELLNNILKHAAATEVMVQLIREEGRFNVIVEDNGKGFDKDLLPANRGSGLTSIRSRVDYLKGQLDIHSEPGKGTLVTIEFNI